ncbi:hypothetical protein EUX98_g9397 [Antrodiella citrinella]|uniref:Uncharacterized protein n=1 Tax=Antrodiella citrinella TaxID=2447956 RepID=A0A4S4LVM0_9APHY|nr:hypothetical protein EUX98_g9397 [Antrodiella citrinella]
MDTHPNVRQCAFLGASNVPLAVPLFTMSSLTESGNGSSVTNHVLALVRGLAETLSSSSDTMNFQDFEKLQAFVEKLEESRKKSELRSRAWHERHQTASITGRSSRRGYEFSWALMDPSYQHKLDSLGCSANSWAQVTSDILQIREQLKMVRVHGSSSQATNDQRVQNVLRTISKLEHDLLFVMD